MDVWYWEKCSRWFLCSSCHLDTFDKHNHKQLDFYHSQEFDNENQRDKRSNNETLPMLVCNWCFPKRCNSWLHCLRTFCYLDIFDIHRVDNSLLKMMNLEPRSYHSSVYIDCHQLFLLQGKHDILFSIDELDSSLSSSL